GRYHACGRRELAAVSELTVEARSPATDAARADDGATVDLTEPDVHGVGDVENIGRRGARGHLAAVRKSTVAALAALAVSPARDAAARAERATRNGSERDFASVVDAENRAGFGYDAPSFVGAPTELPRIVVTPTPWDAADHRADRVASVREPS